MARFALAQEPSQGVSANGVNTTMHRISALVNVDTLGAFLREAVFTETKSIIANSIFTTIAMTGARLFLDSYVAAIVPVSVISLGTQAEEARSHVHTDGIWAAQIPLTLVYIFTGETWRTSHKTWLALTAVRTFTILTFFPRPTGS